MGKNMLKKENRIFKNLYNEFGWDIENSLKRDDWKDTKNLINKGREWIINEVKTSELDKFTPAAVRRLIISLSSKRAFNKLGSSSSLKSYTLVSSSLAQAK